MAEYTSSYPVRRYLQEGPRFKKKVYGILLFVVAKATASSFDIFDSALTSGTGSKRVFLDHSSITPAMLPSAVIVWEATYLPRKSPMSELPTTSGRWFWGATMSSGN